MILREQVLLAPFTTLGVGGCARYLAEVSSPEDVRDVLTFAKESDLPLFVLGGGSNLVVADAGFDGVVVKVALSGIELAAAGSHMLFSVAAGEDWDGFVARAVEADCAGVECLSGIPGTVGGTPVQNVGAYGQEVAETVVEVEAIDRESLEAVCFSNAECGFGYRTSRFNTVDRDAYIIVRVTFRLRRRGQPTLRYTELQNAFADGPAKASLKQVRDAVREIRRKKAMLLVPGDDDCRSAGSFFKNPVVVQSTFEELAARTEALGSSMPSYPADEGRRKLSAAWLVEQAGFAKGYTHGAVGISSRHALAIVNRGGASAAEVVALKDEIQARVRSEFGIDLQPEPVFVGF